MSRIQSISVEELQKNLPHLHDDGGVDFVNVCEPPEYAASRIDGARNIPLSQIDRHIDEFRDKKKIYVHCMTGNRARIAIGKLQKAGVSAQMINVEGGLTQWKKQGFEVRSDQSTSARLPLMRQVFLSAGVLILIGVLGVYLVSEYFIILTLIVGLGLTLSGLTGWCGMAMLLSKMPWNNR